MNIVHTLSINEISPEASGLLSHLSANRMNLKLSVEEVLKNRAYTTDWRECGKAIASNFFFRITQSGMMELLQQIDPVMMTPGMERLIEIHLEEFSNLAKYFEWLLDGCPGQYVRPGHSGDGPTGFEEYSFVLIQEVLDRMEAQMRLEALL